VTGGLKKWLAKTRRMLAAIFLTELINMDLGRHNAERMDEIFHGVSRVRTMQDGNDQLINRRFQASKTRIAIQK
jgi:hypothetical protein